MIIVWLIIFIIFQGFSTSIECTIGYNPLKKGGIDHYDIIHTSF